MITNILILISLFVVKHFICDFVLQSDTMLEEKGTYGAQGGIDHAAVHALGTTLLLLAVFSWRFDYHVIAIVLGILDGIIHYHIDWAKVKLSQSLTVKDREFWVWFGVDQGLHYLTYVGIIGALVL